MNQPALVCTMQTPFKGVNARNALAISMLGSGLAMRLEGSMSITFRSFARSKKFM